MAALGRGSYRVTTHFYQLCGEIAHKKNQFNRVGDEQGNLATIDALRNEMRSLAPWVVA